MSLSANHSKRTDASLMHPEIRRGAAFHPIISLGRCTEIPLERAPSNPGAWAKNPRRLPDVQADAVQSWGVGEEPYRSVVRPHRDARPHTHRTHGVEGAVELAGNLHLRASRTRSMIVLNVSSTVPGSSARLVSRMRTTAGQAPAARRALFRSSARTPCGMTSRQIYRQRALSTPPIELVESPVSICRFTFYKETSWKRLNFLRSMKKPRTL